MRKLILLATVLVFLLSLSSAAFARQPKDFVFSGDSYVGTVTNGYQGYSWNHPDGGKIINLKKIFRDYFTRGHSDQKKRCSKGHSRGIELYYYIDDHKVRHYFYLDPDKDYEVEKYKDENGLTQYSFKVAGWK